MITVRSGQARWVFIMAVVVGLAAATSLLVGSVLAGHGDVSLASSNFEIDTDANLVVDHADPSIDWASVAEVRKDDVPSGQNDDAFGQGSKEDTEVPAVVTGSIPPNKSDLKTFGVFEEVQAGGAGFMHLFWTRVQDPKGTTNMDFEFNQSEVISANGVTPVRTPGDLLIVYELSKGGTVPELFLFTWLDAPGDDVANCEASNTLPCWGDREALTGASNASGSINTSLIADVDSDGLGDLDPRTFGEASVSLDAIFEEDKCLSLGSAYLKSRSSDSFTAALKDYIAPEPVDITNCGTVIIRKQTDPDGAGGSFDFTTALVTDPLGGGSPFSLADDGEKTIKNVIAGTGYTVTEDLVEAGLAGFDLISIDCSASSNPSLVTSADPGTGIVTFDMDVGATVDCTYTNQAGGTIIIAKITDPVSDPTKFAFVGDVAGNLGNGESASQDVVPGNYSSTETVPAGWDLTEISCDDGNSSGDTGTRIATFNVEAGETVTCTFTNVKRGNIVIAKVTEPANDPAEFVFTGDVFGTLMDGDSASQEVVPGTYSSTETVNAGWTLTEILCNDGNSSGDTVSGIATFNVEAGETVTCTFTNSMGAIRITKTAKDASQGAGQHPLEGVSFDVSVDGQVIDSVVTDINGQACIDGLVPGVEHTVTEIVPNGYAVASTSTNPQIVVVTAGATCSNGTPNGVTFENDPLSELEIIFRSLAGPGVTKATSVICTGPNGFASDDVALDDGQNEVLTDLLEGTYTCTIVVDP